MLEFLHRRIIFENPGSTTAVKLALKTRYFFICSCKHQKEKKDIVYCDAIVQPGADNYE